MKTPGPKKRKRGSTGSKKPNVAAAKKKSASFKTKGPAVSSPLVDSLRKRRAAKASGMKKAPHGASGDEAQTKLQELCRDLVAKLGMPEDLLPKSLPPGKKSYTLHHEASAASVQVLHGKGMFYCNTDASGCQPKAPCITWSHHGSLGDAWLYTKRLLSWE